MKVRLISDILLAVKTISLKEKSMPTNTVKTVDVRAVPFFARFLEKQANEGTQVPFTFKYPSDNEDQ